MANPPADAERRRTGYFDDFDVDGLWDEGQESGYAEQPPTEELIRSIEAELGYRLPDAYVELAGRHNGGGLRRAAFPMTEPTGWADDHVMVTGVYAIGRTARYSLCGDLGSTFMQSDWGYPAIGIGIADTPTAGHEQIMLDYRACGPTGEPAVVYVDQEDDYRITPMATDFVSFIRGLVDPEVFEDAAAERAHALAGVDHGSLSPFVTNALVDAPISESALRALGRAIVEDKGFLAVHADPRSRLLLDVMLLLYTRVRPARDYDTFVKGSEPGGISLETMLFFRHQPGGENEFCTGGYAPGFVEDWWQARIDSGDIVDADGWRLVSQAERRVIEAL